MENTQVSADKGRYEVLLKDRTREALDAGSIVLDRRLGKEGREGVGGGGGWRLWDDKVEAEMEYPASSLRIFGRL